MAKRAFGLAGAIEPGRKIFYESLFSQLQIGRMTDLFCAVGAEAGIRAPSLRAVLNAALGEAGRYHGIFGSSLSALDPVTVELGADSSHGVVSVQFTIEEGHALSAELSEPLFSWRLPASDLIFRVDPETRRAEIRCFVPLEFGRAGAGNAEPRFELVSGDASVGDGSAGLFDESRNEYVELGDVEYEAVVPAAGEKIQGTAKGDPTRKILQAARGADGDPGTVIPAGAAPSELAQVLASALPEEEVARIVKGEMSQEELARMVTGNLPEEELARIVKGSSTPEELQELVKFAADKEQLAEMVIRGSTKEEAAQLIRASVGESGIGQAIATALPKEKLATLAATAMPAEELIRFAQESVSPESFVQTVKDSLSPQQRAGFAAQAIRDPGVCKAVLGSLSPAEIAQTLQAAAPQRLAEAAKAEVAGMSSAELAEILSNGLPREEYARLVASSIPRSEFSRVLTEGLPPQEMARSLREGLPKEKFAQLLSAAVPKQELERSVASADPSLAPGPAQERLVPAQVATLLAPKLTRRQALSVLTSVLPQAAGESIFTGAIPREEVVEALKPYLPDPELASEVTDRILETRPEKASPEKASEEPKPDSESDPEPSFDGERARLEKAFHDRLSKVQKSVEFYLARSRNLETQLRAAEEAKRTAEREARAAKVETERFIEKAYQATGSTDDEDEISPKTPSDTPGDVPSDTLTETPAETAPEIPGETSGEIPGEAPREAARKSGPRREPESASGQKSGAARKEIPERSQAATESRAKRDLEAVKFFQKKAREFEQELRAAEAEVRRLNAEHTSELLKLSKEKEEHLEKVEHESRSRHASEKQVNHAHAETVRRLEAKLRIVEEEKSLLLERLSQPKPESPESDDSPESPDSPESENSEPKKAVPVKSKARVEEQDPEEGDPASKEDDAIDVGEKLEATNLEVERDLTGIATRMEGLKENVPDGPARRTVDGLMTSVLQEKAKLMETSKEMIKSVRKKELSFKNREAMLTETVKQLRATSEQRQAAIDRLKHQISELQQKTDRGSQNQAAASEAQLRMKYEQSQRQIEALNREIEKANRRLQQAPQSQGNNLAQERMVAEVKKQLDNATKALVAKKQELELAKTQLHERDRREEQYKRQVMKLQGELMAARSSAKKAS